MFRLLVPTCIRLAALRAAIVVLVLSASPVAAQVSLSGTVSDPIGNLLGGVEILVVDGTRSSVLPDAVTHSDAEGRFAIAGLEAGEYRIAVLKQGYQTFVGHVHAGAREWIDVVLRPALEARSDPTLTLPLRDSWPLRLPRRHILRETDGGAAIDPTPPSAPVGRDAVRVQVEQRFGFRSRADGTGRTGQHGNDTRLRVGSALGERGNLFVVGRHESLDPGSGARAPSSVPGTERSGLRVGMSYDTSLDARLSMNAFYADANSSWAAGASELPTRLSRERRSVGYDAAWTKQLDAASSLALEFDYRDETLGFAELPPGAPEQAGTGGTFANRSVGASGSYEILPGDGHQLQVAFRATVLDSPLAEAYVFGDDRTGAWLDAPGVTLTLDAHDSWCVRGPFALLYGLGYRQVLAADGSSLVVPRFGGSWTAEDLSLRLVLSYHADPGGESGGGLATTLRRAGRLGYRAEAELPVGDGLSLFGATEFDPVSAEWIGFGADGASRRAEVPFVGPGGAAVTRSGIGLVRDVGATRAYFELAHGRAEGTLAVLLPYDLPLQEVRSRNLVYRNGRLGFRFVPYGTQLQLEYRRIEEQPQGSMGAESQQESMALELEQDLLRLQSLGTWRLLMAVRMDSVENHELWSRLHPGELGSDDSLDRRFSAGLAVTF